MLERFNSTIRIKMGKCVDCEAGSRAQPLTAGRCPTHYRLHRIAVNEERRKGREVPSATPTNKKQGEGKKNNELEKWYAMVATFIRSSPRCENCGEPIAERYYRHASAHIVPKSLFPSVATHPLNFLILSASCGCHSEYDGSVDSASKMQIWTQACARFRMFENKITEKHKFLDLFKSKMK